MLRCVRALRYAEKQEGSEQAAHDMRAAAQVLTCAEEFASVRSSVQALGIPVAEDRSGLIFAPLSMIEVPLNPLHALFTTLSKPVNPR